MYGVTNPCQFDDEIVSMRELTSGLDRFITTYKVTYKEADSVNKVHRFRECSRSAKC